MQLEPEPREASLSDASDVAPRRHLIPMQIGDAVVYVEQFGSPLSVETSDDIYVVGPPSPKEAFERASSALQECVRIVGDRIQDLTTRTKPAKVSVEFALTFEAIGKAGSWTLLPVFVS